MNEWSRLVRTVAPSAGPVTLADAKKHLRVYADDEDDEIQIYLDAAVAAIDGPSGIGIALGAQTWRLSLDRFPFEIQLPLGPVTEVTSITYTKEDGTAGTVDTWRADLDSQPCRIWPAYDVPWPVSRCEPGAVKVLFECGFVTVPSDLKAAILLITGHLYEHREAVTDLSAMDLPMGVAAILERYRVGRFA